MDSIDDEPNVELEALVDDVITLFEKLSEADGDSLGILIGRLFGAVNLEQIFATLGGAINWNASYDDVIR